MLANVRRRLSALIIIIATCLYLATPAHAQYFCDGTYVSSVSSSVSSAGTFACLGDGCVSNLQSSCEALDKKWSTINSSQIMDYIGALLNGGCGKCEEKDKYCRMWKGKWVNGRWLVTDVDCIKSDSQTSCVGGEGVGGLAGYNSITGKLYTSAETCRNSTETHDFVCFNSDALSCNSKSQAVTLDGLSRACGGTTYLGRNAKENCEADNIDKNKWCKSGGSCTQTPVAKSNPKCPDGSTPYNDNKCSDDTDTSDKYCIYATGYAYKCDQPIDKSQGCVSKSIDGFSAVSGTTYASKGNCESALAAMTPYCYKTATKECVSGRETKLIRARDDFYICPEGFNQTPYQNKTSCERGEVTVDMPDVSIADPCVENLCSNNLQQMKLRLFKGDIVLGGGGSDDLVLKFVRDIVFPIAAAALLLLISYAGFQMVQGATLSNQGLFDQGKKRLTAAIIGFVLLLLSYGIYEMIRAALGFNK